MDQIPPRIYGLIGYPVKHSLSAVMHNAAFRHLKINAEYRLFPVKEQELEDFLLKDVIVKDTTGCDFTASQIAGFNITVPHKVKAKEILERNFPFDKNAPLAWQTLHYVELIGAVNTVKRMGDILEYRNTDAGGFLKSLKNDLDFDIKNKNALITGCGGAGRAVIAALSFKQSRINKVFIRDIKQEAVLAAKENFQRFAHVMQKLEFITQEQLPEVIKDCQLLVNASSLGMREDDASVVDRNLLHKELCVYDVVYNRQTQLIKDAKAQGLRSAGGLGMLLYQGVGVFEIWTGQNAPVEVMREALKEGVKNL